MKSYIIVTGAAFCLLVVAHIVRVIVEGTHVLTEPVFLLSTIASAGLCIWAALLLKKFSQRNG